VAVIRGVIIAGNSVVLWVKVVAIVGSAIVYDEVGAGCKGRRCVRVYGNPWRKCGGRLKKVGRFGVQVFRLLDCTGFVWIGSRRWIVSGNNGTCRLMFTGVRVGTSRVDKVEKVEVKCVPFL